ISETAEQYKIELAVPGYKKENFKLNLEKHVLRISGTEQTSTSEESEQTKFSRKEFKVQSFIREFNLPDAADLNQVDAHYTDGVLTVLIPKKEEAKILSREITVK